MTSEELKAALEALIVEAKAKGPATVPTEAERDAVIRATRLKPGESTSSWEVEALREDLRDVMFEQMSILQASIATLNTIADELVVAAHVFDSEPAARALHSHAQQRRVRALEMQGRLAALSERYAARFHPEK